MRLEGPPIRQPHGPLPNVWWASGTVGGASVNVIDSADLWFRNAPDPDWFGWPDGSHHSDATAPASYDPVRYVVWVPPGRPGDELAPRQALHVQVAA
jgi:hypothetical protein